MMGMIWVVLFVALTGLHCGYGLPVRPTPPDYPHDGDTIFKGWGADASLYAVIPALALVVTAIVLIFGCTWCYRHKDCKPNEGTDNQIFTASAQHLHAAQRVLPPDSGFSEPANNNISEDNNNGPISLREMQNIANNNAAAYIVSENEERNRISRESVVEFEPLPTGFISVDPLEHCADWFGGEDFPRNNLQYLREIGRGWFGRVVEGEIEEAGASTTVAVKILNQNATLEDKARFLDESKMYRDVRHENILAFIGRCLQEDPWILIFELCTVDLRQYLIVNRPKMAILNESGVPLRLMCDVTSALAYLHSRGYTYGRLCGESVLVRGEGAAARAVVGRYAPMDAQDCLAPEVMRGAVYTTSSEVWSLGTLIWEVCSWGSIPTGRPSPPPDLPCPYKSHLYQVMVLCWHADPTARPTAAQVHALLTHLQSTHADRRPDSADFEDRWQRLKPNTIPKIDEHIAIIHAPSSSLAGSDLDLEHNTLSVDLDTAVSRSSSIMSDRDPLSVQIKSESLTNLHGSLEDVRNIYLTHNETPLLECHQGNLLEEAREREQDRSDASMDPWLKDIIAGSQDDVSYYKDVSDVIKNLDNILNSEKTSSSESSHQASPSRDNLSLDCKKEYPVQSSLVKSPGITNFQNILDMGFASNPGDGQPCVEDEVDRDTIGTLSHSFERHSDSTSQHTLENLTPDTPMKDLDVFVDIESQFENVEVVDDEIVTKDTEDSEVERLIEITGALPDILVETDKSVEQDTKLPNEVVDSTIPKLKELCVASMPSVSETSNEQSLVKKDCQTSCDNVTDIRTDNEETKSIDDVRELITESLPLIEVEAAALVKDREHAETSKQRILLPLSADEITTSNEEGELITESFPLDEIEAAAPVKNREQMETSNRGILLPLSADETTTCNDDGELLTESLPFDEVEAAALVLNSEQSETRKREIILPLLADETTNNEEGDTLPSVTDEVSSATQENDTLHIKLEDIGPDSISENNYSKDETILISDLVDTTNDSSKDEQQQNRDEVVKVYVAVDLKPVTPEQTPVSVQSIIGGLQELAHLEMENADSKTVENVEVKPIHLPPEIVQNPDKDTPVLETESLVRKEVVEPNNDNVENNMPRSDRCIVEDINERSEDSTVYMDLINNTNSQIVKDSTVDNSVELENIKEVSSGLDAAPTVDGTFSVNDSTVYLDLPSFNLIKKTDDFLHIERMMSSKDDPEKFVTSTPIVSDSSVDTTLVDIEKVKDNETAVMSDTNHEDVVPGTSTAKVADNISPFDSPSHRSHHTDTYDENSSVVLGPFENCALELHKGVKPNIEPVELPRDELLAFSSNFSEINLETPSPLRDGNFLNEVPDIIPGDLQFDDLASISETKVDLAEVPSDDTEGSGSGTQKHVSPSTPPNSPGIFLASTSQQKYLVDIDLSSENVPEPDSSSLRSIDINQIELQITSKLAMAENENNLNIEYSGPLTVEGLIEEGGAMRESDAIPESYLAGNGGLVDDVREEISLDEECVKALRNELELKLPLAQVAAIEPQCESEPWPGELPPPPELVVSYPGALSPIQEETPNQLSAYETDANWNPSTRTESSESYPEPCNNSTDSVTELPPRDVTTPPSREHTYTLNRTEAPQHTNELTMSADSLNASPHKSREPDVLSPIDDKTYIKDDGESSCEHISQVTPFLVSPTTDTSDTGDNATRVSTLSKTTLPTDAKLSKPSDTQCLSKATSIDSWCSNDTLYNVEENFDDLALDPDPLILARDEPNSDSTDTLTHDEDKEPSRCSTYIVHDSKSERCETFSPDSITENDNYTYTKVRTEPAATPSGTDLNDSTKNTPTKDLAYETLMSGMPSFSNCTTEVASGLEEAWRLPQPELVRRSPMEDVIELSPPKPIEVKTCEQNWSPQLAAEPSFGKMESVEISCLHDELIDGSNESRTENQDMAVMNDSPKYNYRNMSPSMTSTPLVNLNAEDENVEAIPMNLPEITAESEQFMNELNFQAFQRLAAERPEFSSNATNEAGTQESEALLEGESKTLSRNSNRDSFVVSERTPNYSDFENSAVCKPQEVSSRDRSSQSMESGISSEEFRHFENSAKFRPQDLSSLIDASSLLLKSERMSSELAMSSLYGLQDQTSQSNSKSIEPMQSLDINPLSITNLIESHELVDAREPTSTFLINFDMEDETEQPHSIIVTEIPMNPTRISPNRTYDSSIESNLVDFNYAYESYDSNGSKNKSYEQTKLKLEHPKVNGEINSEQPESLIVIEQKSPTTEHPTVTNHDIANIVEDDVNEYVQIQSNDVCNEKQLPESKDLPNGSMQLAKSPKTESIQNISKEIRLNGSGEKYATVNFLNETFEELIESSVDDGDSKDDKLGNDELLPIQESITEVSDLEKKVTIPAEDKTLETSKDSLARSSTEAQEEQVTTNGVNEAESRMSTVTEDFLQNEKKYATLDSYFPMLSDIRFTGPASEMMSTSFQDSPTSPMSPECEQDSKPNTAAEILKEWDSDSDSHSSNSSSGEFIWKDGDGHETSVVPTTHFDHQRGSGGPTSGGSEGPRDGGSGGSGASGGSGDSGSGSEGDEVEFVPSSWDCRAAPSKSSLRSLEAAPESKKRVVFKRQKYHCVYEYPREANDAPHSPAYLPDLSTYCEWDPTSAEEAELCYGQLFSSPSALGAAYPLRAGIAFGADYDEDFFISSSARPFESLGLMSTTSQFFPGMHAKRSLLERELSHESGDELPPLSPLPTTLVQSRTPSLDFTTPDSGVEDVTPGSLIEERFEVKKQEPELTWRAIDSGSSSESVSPSSPGGELGGLRHTRDKLKLDLPPSPHASCPSPRHNRVFNFILDKPKRRPDEPPLVMTDDTPVVSTSLRTDDEPPPPEPEPTFSTFGKTTPKIEPEQKIILTDEDESPKVEGVKGEGTVLDSGDEDSGIESSSKATLERKASNV